MLFFLIGQLTTKGVAITDPTGFGSSIASILYNLLVIICEVYWDLNFKSKRFEENIDKIIAIKAN